MLLAFTNLVEQKSNDFHKHSIMFTSFYLIARRKVSFKCKFRLLIRIKSSVSSFNWKTPLEDVTQEYKKFLVKGIIPTLVRYFLDLKKILLVYKFSFHYNLGNFFQPGVVFKNER